MTSMEQEIYKYWLGSSNLNSKKVMALLNYFGNPKDAFYASDKVLEDMKKSSISNGIKFSNRDMEMLINSRNLDELRNKLHYLHTHGIDYITIVDDSYPDKLRHIYDPPFLLYIKGNPIQNHKKHIAVIGARECSPYGKEIAKYLAGAIAREGIVIISGLARGVDSYAHMGATSVGGSTYAVLGSGIDICYPAENIELYMEIQQKGTIISEYEPGIKPLSYHFPMRNRIISALSDGILVIEAREKSGSLITVDMGLDQGKNIYAVLGRITDKLSTGCNNLIKMGAKVVTSPSDILEDFIDYYSDSGYIEQQPVNNLNEEEKIVYELINFTPKHIMEISELSGIPIDKIMEHLLSLELKNLIKQYTKNYYVRSNMRNSPE